MGRNIDWSDADKARVLELWEDGKSARDISLLMPGRSRNSVLGIVHRSAGAVKRIVPNTRAPSRVPAQPKIQKPLVTTIEPEEEIYPLEPPIFMGELESAHCRWPYETNDVRGLRYCGHAKKGGGYPYCEGHAKKAYQVNKPYERKPKI